MARLSFRSGWRVRSGVACAAVLSLLSPVMAQQAPAPLDLVPAGAQMAIIVPSLSGLSQKIAALNNALGLNVPGMADALGEFKQNAGLTQGLRDDGPLVVSLPQITGNPDGGSPAFLVAVPVSKYGEFVRSLSGNPDNALSELKMPDGQNAFSKNIGGEAGFAIIGAQKALVEGFQAGGGAATLASAGKVGARAISGSDVSIVFNVQSMAPTLQPMLQSAMAIAMMEATRGQNDPAMAATQKAITGMYSDALSALLRDTAIAVVGLDLSEAGVGMSWTAQLKPNSYMAGIFTNGSPAAGLITKLPERPYLFAMAMNFGNVNVKQMVTDAMAKLPEANVGGPVVGMIRSWLPLMGTIQGLSQAYYVPPGGAVGGSMLQSAGVISTTDARGYIQAFQTQATALNGKQFPMGKPANPNAPVPAITFTTNYNANAVQVDGVNVDQYQVSFTLPPELAQQAGPAAMMLMGGNGYTGFIAAANNFVVQTTVPDMQLVKAALASIKDNAGIGAAGPIPAVRAKLPPDAAMEAYVNLGGAVSLANGFLAAFGAPQINVPPDLSPIAMGLGVEQSGLAYRLYVPMDTMKFVKELSMQVGQMRGGAAPPAGGGNRGGGAPPAPF